MVESAGSSKRNNGGGSAGSQNVSAVMSPNSNVNKAGGTLAAIREVFVDKRETEAMRLEVSR